MSKAIKDEPVDVPKTVEEAIAKAKQYLRDAEMGTCQPWPDKPSRPQVSIASASIRMGRALAHHHNLSEVDTLTLMAAELAQRLDRAIQLHIDMLASVPMTYHVTGIKSPKPADAEAPAP